MYYNINLEGLEYILDRKDYVKYILEECRWYVGGNVNYEEVLWRVGRMSKVLLVGFF